VRSRLLSLSKVNGQSFDLVLTRFALERLLFRLSQSRYADRFVLKGAMLLMSWFKDPHRGTPDLELPPGDLADLEAEELERAADLVLHIQQLAQQKLPAGQQHLQLMTPDRLHLNCAEPAGARSGA
jgi:hypothetical protein